MNISTVQANLRATIAGKEHMLDSHKRYLRSTGTSGPENTAIFAIIQFLEINLTELQRILQDVEQCVAKDVEQSWRDNPDRSGGQFTEEEMRSGSEWR